VVGANVLGVMAVGRQGRLNKLWISNDDGLSLLINEMGGGGVGRMLGVGRGSGAILPSRSVQRDWMASILSGGASWMPAMTAVILLWHQ
jgi:hypothetical protein